MDDNHQQSVAHRALRLARPQPREQIVELRLHKRLVEQLVRQQHHGHWPSAQLHLEQEKRTQQFRRDGAGATRFITIHQMHSCSHVSIHHDSSRGGILGVYITDPF